MIAWWYCVQYGGKISLFHGTCLNSSKFKIALENLPTKLQHIWGFWLMSVPKFKLNHDPNHPDNKRNDRCLQTVCMFCTITVFTRV